MATDKEGNKSSTNHKKEADINQRDTSSLNRRSYLQLAGSTAVSVAAVGSYSDSVAARQATVDINDGQEISSLMEGIDDGDTLVLPEGTYELRSDVNITADNFTFDGNGSVIETHGRLDIRINGTGWEFSHLGFDPQNDADPDDWCRILPRGNDWHLHHLAWLRRNDTTYQNGTNNRLGCILPGIDSGGQAEITDCWFGHGVHPNHGKSCIKCWGVMDGKLTLRRCYIKGYGVYGANSTDDQIYNEGTTHAEDCYFENNYLAALRTGGHYQTTKVDGCVMNMSDRSEVPTREGIDGHYSRGVYIYHGPVEIRNTQISMAPERAIDVSPHKDVRQRASAHMFSGAYDGTLKNENRITIEPEVGSNPDTTPPANCVTSPEEAYRGTTDETETEPTEPEFDHTLTIQGEGEATNYTLSVSDRLGEGSTGSLEPYDEISGTTATGWVTSTSHVDKYGFDGSVTDFQFMEGEATVYLDGEQTDPAELNQSPDEHTLAIQGQGTSVNYEFSVDGTLSGDGDLEQWDDISDSTASGWVTSSSHTDTYRFTGDITAFSPENGDVTVYLDDEQVNSADLVQ